MALTPEEIVNYPLKQSLRGYSVGEVDALLDEVADTVEVLERELTEVRERLARSETRLAETSETETTLKRTLVTAQRAAEQSIEEAEERAEEIVAEARREAEKIVDGARAAAEDLREEILQDARGEEAAARRRRRELDGHLDALRAYELETRGRLRGLLEEQLTLLEELRTGAPPEGPPTREDAAAADGVGTDDDEMSRATGDRPDEPGGEPDEREAGDEEVGEEVGDGAARGVSVDPDPTDPAATDPARGDHARGDPTPGDSDPEASGGGGGESGSRGGRPPPAAAPRPRRDTLWPGEGSTTGDDR